MKVHLVLPEDKKKIYEAVKRNAEITGWDYTLDTASQWAASGEGESPDVFFVHGNVLVSSVDTGGNRDSSFIKRLKEIRTSRPLSRIVVVLYKEREKDNEFLKAITALGIYDIHLVNQFSESNIREWLETPRTFADVSRYVSVGDSLKSKHSLDLRLGENKISFLDNIMKKLRKSNMILFNKKKQQRNVWKVLINKTSNIKKELLYRLSADKKETAESQEEHSIGVKLEPYKTKVFLVVGAARRVGATSFALALAEVLSKKYEVRVLDAGGGASSWLAEDSEVSCSPMPPASIVPGAVTIVDAGVEIPEGVQPLSETVFVVTDMSREAVNLKRFSMSPNVHIVGNRGAPEEELRSLAMLWNMEVFCNLPEDPGVKKAEMRGVAPAPKSWFKQLKKIL